MSLPEQRRMAHEQITRINADLLGYEPCKSVKVTRKGRAFIR